MQFYRKIISFIEKEMFSSGRIIILYGPRRTGKTTLTKYLQEKYQKTHIVRYIQCESIDAQRGLTTQNAARLRQFIGEDVQLVILDEAQSIKNIGINLKLLIDTYPDLQIIATGSSSFDLANQIKEPLTGRIWEFLLPPITLQELETKYDRFAINEFLEDLLLYGLYPEVVTSSTNKKRLVLEEITRNYLYKDILNFEGRKNSDFVLKLLQLLAFQIGSEVSINEISTKLERSKTLTEKYIYLLEQSFVIFKLSPLKRNLRNEVTSKNKIFFWDIGIRNAIIQNYNSVNVRPDVGALWENFCIAERMKFLQTNRQSNNRYFWRMHNKHELDYVEEYGGKLYGFEIKWNKERFKEPKEFLNAYKESSVKIVNKHNYWDFLGKGL
jgi:predicted AAA+ superfamily ATPase